MKKIVNIKIHQHGVNHGPIKLTHVVQGDALQGITGDAGGPNSTKQVDTHAIGYNAAIFVIPQEAQRVPVVRRYLNLMVHGLHVSYDDDRSLAESKENT